MKTQKFLKRALLFIFSLSLSSAALAALPGTHIIYFGGTHGYTYFPSTLNALVGDTIKWIGDFGALPMHSVSVPSGAPTFGLINTGDTFNYIITTEGTYFYEQPIFASIGMSGSFIATRPLYGLTNEGREFYLGMLYPSYNYVAGTYVGIDFNVFALVSTYYENDISVNYFDPTGSEIAQQKYHVVKGGALKIPLNISLMQMDTASDIGAYKCCHIKSKFPITVYYISVGACSGGSYLALPVMSLGKNYVAASYNDNPGNGALIGTTASTLGYLPTQTDYAGGEFLVIATEEETNVEITPTATTATGHPALHPFFVNLARGQCYLVRTNGTNEDNDISGSLIESDKPIAVISGHENAALGGVDPFALEARDFMIEQMTPIEYWDSTGYISVPLAEPNPPANEGHGDTYRVYTFDSTTAEAHLDVQSIDGGYDMSTKRLVSPSQIIGVTSPAEAYSTNGKKIALMQYDERSQLGEQGPWPCPSMMTVVPKSRWKTSYFFAMPGVISKEQTTLTAIFINVIAPNLANIKLTIDGGVPQSLFTLDRFLSFNTVSKTFPDLKAVQYLFFSNYPAYHLYSDDPFMVYYYCFQYFQPDPSHGQSDFANFYDEFASPAGMQLNTGTYPGFVIDTTINCSGWHICARDTGGSDPGIKSIMLINDPDGVYFQLPDASPVNVTLDTTNAAYHDGELHPYWHSTNSYCFDIQIVNPLAASSADIAIIDNLGNAQILHLKNSASALNITTSPPSALRTDNIVFPVKKIGDRICTTFVLKNAAPTGGTPITFYSASFIHPDTDFQIQLIPLSPHTIIPGDSLTFDVCYTTNDSLRHRDSLLMNIDCYAIPISFDAHGATGLINAQDLYFSIVHDGDTVCKNLMIKNDGDAPFLLTESFHLTDTINFSLDPKSHPVFPIVIQPGASISLSICFHPSAKGTFSDTITWSTDLNSSFAHSLKDYSLLAGTSVPIAEVHSSSGIKELNIYPNPDNSKSITISFPLDGVKMTLHIFDMLGREVYKQEIHGAISQIEVPVENFPVGSYFVRLASEKMTMSGRFEKIK
jgi:plastocyanin